MLILSWADEQEQSCESCSESVEDEMMIDDVDDHDDEQAPAFLWFRRHIMSDC